jgi:hypothetical protein
VGLRDKADNNGELYSNSFIITLIDPSQTISGLQLIEGSGYFFHDKMIAPVLLMGRGLLPPRKAKHGVGSCWRESFK